jgi:hypothetical protein
MRGIFSIQMFFNSILFVWNSRITQNKIKWSLESYRFYHYESFCNLFSRLDLNICPKLLFIPVYQSC